MKSKKDTLLVSLVAILLGLTLGLIILMFSGINPIEMFKALLRGSLGINEGSGLNLRYTGEFIVTSMPIVLTGLSVAFAYRTGLFNIGAEGQVMVGAMASIVVAICVPMPAPFHAIACVLAGVLAGALYGFIPGFFKAKFNVHEVVVCIMLNYTGMHFSNYIIKSLPGASQSKTGIIPATASLRSEFLASITNNSRLNWGIVFVLIAIFLYWFIIEKTSFGYSLKATGFNSAGAEYAGLKVKRNTIYSMMIAGALAGLAGAIIALGTFQMGRVIGSFENYGFDGIAVAFVGAFNAIGILLSGLLFGLLKVTQPLMQSAGIPKEIAEIISSSIVLFVAMQYGIKLFFAKFKHKKNERIERRDEK